MIARIRRGVVALAAVLSMVAGVVLVAAPPVGAVPPSPGEVWTSQSADVASSWNSVSYLNSIFIAVGNAGAVITSTDGVTWTPRAAASASQWTSVAYGNGTFVAVGYGGVVMTSTDGVTWTGQTAAAVNNWSSVTFGGGVFVAVSTDGANRVMTSTDGATWTPRSAASAGTWASVTYGNSTFVAVASGGTGRVMTSTDGATWAARTAAEDTSWQSVTYANSRFVAVASSGTNRVMTSTDGATWTGQTAAEANSWRSVTFGNGRFVAVAFSGTNRVMTSTDGATWTARTAAVANSWRSVTFGDEMFVAVSNNGTNRVMTSMTASAPDAPTSLVATPGDGSASISFTAGADGGTAITKYQYTIDNPGIGIPLWTDVIGTTSPVSITGLTNGITYDVWLRAVNRAGAGVASAAVSVTPAPSVVAPSAPSGLTATPGDGSASVAFTAGADGGAAISKYQVKVGSGTWTDVVGTTSPITVSGLRNYATVNIRLRAVNSAGAGAASTAVSVWPRLASSALTSVKVEGTSKVRAAFAALTPVGGTVSHYWVYAYAKGTNTVVGSCRSTAAARGCLILGLTAGTEYDVAVRGFFTLTGSPTVLATTDSARQTVRTNS